ncbi:MAG TPA: hypothetical protein VJ461_06015 [Candidatus Nanoarchaeia archaeon]|nr:hypothetical protein [Candidatus Nanoarchaeia archaeon]
MPDNDGRGPRWLYSKREKTEQDESNEGELEKEVRKSPRTGVKPTGVGPCGNGIPYGGGRGYCGGRKEDYQKEK